MPGSDEEQAVHAAFASVWQRPERPSRGPRPAISRDQIVRAAVALADAEGLPAVSMRRLAAALGVGTMSLYWHVASKQDLVDLMCDAVFWPAEQPDRPSGDWRADLLLVARETRAVVHRHAWLAAITGANRDIGPNFLRHIEFSLAAVAGLGLDATAVVGMVTTVDDYVRGFVLGELAEAEATRRTGLTQAQRFEATAGAILRRPEVGDRYPTLVRMTAELRRASAEASHPDDERFEFGLGCLLDGIAARIAERRP